MKIYKNLVKTAIINGIVKEIDDRFVISCPKCGRNKVLKTRENVRRAIKYNRGCNKCLGGLKTLGKKHTEEYKQKMSIIHKKRYSNIDERKKTSNAVKVAMHRPDVRVKHIQALADSQYLGKTVDKGQIELLKKWNGLGFNFEPNYQVKTDQYLFYLDGYDKQHNVILEYDSKYHLKNKQKQKDLIRQQKIINILKPKKFWRYDSVGKKIKNVS